MTSRLALGTVQFGLPYGIVNKGGQIDHDEAAKIIACARINRISTIDTAMAYGESEKILGNIGVSDFKVITKLPEIPEDIIDVSNWIMQEVTRSLERLSINKLDGLLLHHPMQLKGKHGREIAEALSNVKKEGMVNKIGVSIYATEELSVAMEYFDIQIVQSPFNLLDRQLNNSGWLYRLHSSGIEIHARSIFLQGLLLTKNSVIRNRFKRWKTIWDKWDRWLEEKSLSPISVCLGFVESFPQINKLVVGVDSLAHLNELIINSNSTDIYDYPVIECSDTDLINPSRWLLN